MCMIMNLFGYEKSVVKLGLLIQFTHLKSSSYNEGTKMLKRQKDLLCSNFRLSLRMKWANYMV